ncbi:Outer membrane protein OprM precursor [Legionella massiliensis]|uniref:Outer membrane protein OprM n=1 Tax=Legionella massiliensis TaxID=1034943 RepID=A0A078KS41_9GAMM|nr:efflux transporter outer membrane subunit [Legionella massiliensis]CDZ75901.1 Outer membrane protein OprM precursor [Legionella massiliensis]CEE11639.1 Outer membrane protein OprM precursor [Legionella massiliensis]
MRKVVVKRVGLCFLLSSLLAACSFAPKYQRPLMPLPIHYKETDQWKPAQSAGLLNKVDFWWQLYNDPVLDELEQRVTVANQNLKVAYARYQEARAAVQVERSAYYPTLLGIANANRQQVSRHTANVSTKTRYSDYLIGDNLVYQVDLWGRIRNSVASSESSANASAADLAAVALSLHAELATDYFALRGDEEAQRVLDSTVSAYKKALDLTRQRYKGGAAPIADVDQAETQLENARSLAADMRLQRAQLEHAIAVLVGEIPANFIMPKTRAKLKLVALAPQLPSTLLERRPDIIAAEERVKAANAEIGVACAAFFPSIDLVSVSGFESQKLANLISAPSNFWSLGQINALSLTQPLANLVIFDGGRLRGLLNAAKASYHETVATYRQTVLTAFQEVEDSLAALRWLDQENRSQTAATAAALRALQQSKNRYVGGIVNYLDVVVNENTALQSELTLVDIRTRRQLASVQLIKALGGGWSCRHVQCLKPCQIEKSCAEK